MKESRLPQNHRQKTEKDDQEQEKQNLLLPSFLEKAGSFPHEGVGPEPPLGFAADSFGGEARLAGPEAAAEDVVIAGGEDGFSFRNGIPDNPAGEGHILEGVQGLVLRQDGPVLDAL